MGKKLNLKWVTDIIGEDYKNWKPSDTVLIQAQTGTGKSYFTQTKLTKNLKFGGKMLIVANRVRLKRQLKLDLCLIHNIPTPQSEQEIDELTTIGNVTITSYQSISDMMMEDLYNGTKSIDLNMYDICLFEETHFFFSDSGYNNKARYAFEKIVKERHRNTIKVYISATMEEVKKTIVDNAEKGMGKIGKVHEYSTGIDYSYVKPHYFKHVKDIVSTIKNDKTDDKWLFFVSNKNDGNYVLDELGEDICSFITAENRDDEESLSIVMNDKFNKKVLVSTKVLDNGVNIKDEQLKHVVIMAWDRVTFIQMLGRKRVDINNAQEVNLYISMRYKKSFMSKIANLRHKKEQVDMLKKEIKEFQMKYDNDLKHFKDVNELFYRDHKTGGYKLNKTGYARILNDLVQFDLIVKRFEKEGEWAFVREQLDWIGLKDKTPQNRLIEDVVLDEEIESLEQYLESIVGDKLLKEDQKKLIEFIGLKDNRGRLQKSLNQFNAYFEANRMPYMIVSKRTSKTENGNKKYFRYWEVLNNISVQNME